MITNATARRGPGRLVLVVGPSGSGKDTLISHARERFADNTDVDFPLRVVTRTDMTGEEHLYLSEEDFTHLEEMEGFFLTWRAHGFSYGVPIGAEARLAAGNTVIVNASRKIIEKARLLWPQVTVVHVLTRSEVLRERLVARGRESLEEIERRVARAAQIPVAGDKNTIIIDNSGPIEAAVAAFYAVLDDCVVSA